MIEVNQEIRNRIRLSVAAYAYEYDNNSIMSDAEFDELSKKINPNEATDYVKLDEFFQKEFHPDTGMWIRNHPDINGIKRIYEDFYKSGDM